MDKQNIKSLAECSDFDNNVLNELAYADLKDDCIGKKLSDAIVGIKDSSGKIDSGRTDSLETNLESQGFNDYIIRGYENDNSKTGFVAIAIENPETGEVGMTFRGTENMDKLMDLANIFDISKTINEQLDTIDNIAATVYGNSTQDRKAKQFFKKYCKSDGNNYLYGHSKGGELVANVFAQYSKMIKKAHVINAQPINPYNLSLGQIKAFWSGKYDAVDIEGDMVSKIGIEIYPVRYAKCKEDCYGFPESHNTSSAEFDNGKYMEITHLTRFASQAVLQSLLVLLVMSIQKKCTDIRTLLLEGEKIYALTINEAQKTVMAIRNLYDRYNIVWNQYKNQVENFLNHVSYTIRYSLDKDFRETCNYLNANQFIQVNTDNLRNYSQQLGRISNRINNLDARIGNLKKEAVIMNSLYINRSVSVTSENYKIKKIISYLNDTASEFEMMEKEIQKTIS